MAGPLNTRDGIRLTGRQFKSQLHRVYSCYIIGLVRFVVTLAVAERLGLPQLWIGSHY